MSAPRPSVVRTIGPTTAARVHVVEPQGFNDAQEVGDRLKANQPVILNLQGLPRELQRRLIDFSSGLAYAVAARCSGSPTRCSCSRRATSRSPRRRRSGCRPGACSNPDPCASVLRGAASPSTSSSSPARAVLSWFPVRGGTFLASLNTLLFELTEPVLRPVRRIIPPVGMFDISFMVVFFAADRSCARCSPPADRGGSTCSSRRPLLATMASHGRDPAGTPEHRDQGLVARLPPRRGRRPARARGGHDRGPRARSCRTPPAVPVAHRGRSGPRRRAAEVPLPSSRDDAEMLQRTLLLAQRAADDAVERGAGARRQLLEESEAKAQALVERSRGHRPSHRRGRASPPRGRDPRPVGTPRAAAGRRRRARAVRDRVPRPHPRRDRGRPRQPRYRRGASRPPSGPSCTTSSCRSSATSRPRPRSTPPRRPTPRSRRRSSTSVEDQSAWDPSPDSPRHRRGRTVGRPDHRPPRPTFASEAAAGRSPVAAPPRPAPAAEWPAARAGSVDLRRTGGGVVVALVRRRLGTGGAGVGRPRTVGARRPRSSEPFASEVRDRGHRHRHRLPRRRRVLRLAARSGPRRRAARPARRRAGCVLRRRRRATIGVGSVAAASAATRSERISATRLAVDLDSGVASASASAIDLELDREHLAGDPVAVRVHRGLDAGRVAPTLQRGCGRRSRARSALRWSLSSRISSRAMPSARSSSSRSCRARPRSRRPARARAPRATRRGPRRRRVRAHGRAVDEREVVAAVGVERALDRRRRRPTASAPSPAGICLPDLRPEGAEVRDAPCTSSSPSRSVTASSSFTLSSSAISAATASENVRRRGASTSARGSGWRTLSFASLRAREPERHDRAGPLHLGFERRRRRAAVVGHRPVGEVHRLASVPAQVAVQLVGDERGERREQQRERREALVQRRVRRRGRRPSRSAAATGARTSSRGRRRTRSSACAPRSASKPRARR